jgi:hypothetical protein
MLTVAYHLVCTSFLFNGCMIPRRLCIQIHRHDVIGCLSGRDLSSYEFVSVTMQGGFIPISLKPIDNRLNIIM